MDVLRLYRCPLQQETGILTTVDTADTQDVETGIPADSGEISDTSDTEETDTQETDTPVDPDEYTNDDFMMGHYIELKDDLFLVNELQYLGEYSYSLFKTEIYALTMSGALPSR